MPNSDPAGAGPDNSNAGTSGGNDRGKAVLAKVGWRLFPFMMLLYVVNYLDRINISFAGPPMKASLHFNDEAFGLGAGVFFISYFLCGVPSNIMLERIGTRRWIATISVLWGIVSVSMAFVRDLNCFYFVRFLLGATESGFFPGMILYLTYWFPKHEHGKAVAKFMSAIPFAGVLGGLISSRILLMHGILGLEAWKWLFIITGAPAIFLGLLVLPVLCDGPAHCSWLNDEERGWLLQRIAEDQSAARLPEQEGDQKPERERSAGNVITVLTDLRVWHLALLYFCLTLGMYGFQLWLPQIIMSFDKLDESKAALISSVPALCQAMGMILVAASSDRTQERRLHVACSAVLAAAGLLLCGFCHNPLLSLACLSVTAFGIWGTVGPFWAIPTSYLRTGTAAAGIGLINSVGNLGGFAGPSIVGFIKQRTPDFIYSLGALAVSLVVAGLLVLATSPRKAAASEKPD